MSKRKQNKKYTEEEQIYWSIETAVLYDYVNFANRLRTLQALDNPQKKYSMKQDGKRMYLVLLTEIYQKSLEDLAAILLSFYRRFNADPNCEYQKKFGVNSTPVCYTLINYKIKEAEIEKVLDLCPTQKDFTQKLHIDDIGYINIELLLPNLDIQNYYSEVYSNIQDWKDDQKKRFKIYNKIKHGPMVIGSGKILNSQNPDAPSVIYNDKDATFTDHPLIVHSLQFTKNELILLQSGVVKIGKHIKDLIAIYLCKNYPEYLKEQGFSSALLFFKKRRPNAKEDS